MAAVPTPAQRSSTTGRTRGHLLHPAPSPVWASACCKRSSSHGPASRVDPVGIEVAGLGARLARDLVRDLTNVDGAVDHLRFRRSDLSGLLSRASSQRAAESRSPKPELNQASSCIARLVCPVECRCQPEVFRRSPETGAACMIISGLGFGLSICSFQPRRRPNPSWAYKVYAMSHPVFGLNPSRGLSFSASQDWLRERSVRHGRTSSTFDQSTADTLLAGTDETLSEFGSPLAPSNSPDQPGNDLGQPAPFRPRRSRSRRRTRRPTSST